MIGIDREKNRIIEKETKIDDFMIYSPIKQHSRKNEQKKKKKKPGGSSVQSTWCGGSLNRWNIIK